MPLRAMSVIDAREPERDATGTTSAESISPIVSNARQVKWRMHSLATARIYRLTDGSPRPPWPVDHVGLHESLLRPGDPEQ